MGSAGAQAAYRRGIELNPRATYTLGVYANYLMSMGRFEEAAEIGARIIDLEPVAPDGYWQVGWALDHLRRDGEALAQYERAMDSSPNDPNLLLELSQFHGEGGFWRPPVTRTGRRVCWARLHRLLGWDDSVTIMRSPIAKPTPGGFSKQLISRGEQEYVPSTCPAVICAGLGEIEQALDLLEQGYKKRDVIMVWLKVRHQFDPLRADPRFQDLLLRMNFPS